MGVNAKRTTIAYCDTVDGTFESVGHLYGQIVLPEGEVPVEKFRPNDAVKPAAMIGDEDLGDVEIRVAYEDHATYTTLAALQGTTQFVRFVMANGNYFTYEAVVAKVPLAGGTEDGGYVGTLKLVVLDLADDGDAVPE